MRAVKAFGQARAVRIDIRQNVQQSHAKLMCLVAARAMVVARGHDRVLLDELAPPGRVAAAPGGPFFGLLAEDGALGSLRDSSAAPPRVSNSGADASAGRRFEPLGASGPVWSPGSGVVDSLDMSGYLGVVGSLYSPRLRFSVAITAGQKQVCLLVSYRPLAHIPNLSRAALAPI